MDRMALKPMKRIIVLLLVAAMVAGISSCTQDQQKKEEQQHLESMMAILVQVQKNLGRIRQKEAVVVRLSSDVEGRKTQSAEQIGKEIYSNIRFIDSTLSASKNLVSRLEKENHDSKYRVEAVDRMTGDLKGDIETKGREVATMKGEISKLNKQISQLMSTVDVMDEVISDQESQMSKAYYISGTTAQLAAKGVLVAPGGIARFFGAGPVLANDFDTKTFKQIDISETRDLFFDKPSRNLHIITPHTKGSYDLVGGKNSSLLLIRDEAEFWRKSRCLIIVVD
ncbi:MAG: hypothetical protein HGB22_02120 [Chlorobiaceae bacterium]|nr:hypothetical protein [Chlorobiaceae bacterium]